MNREEYLKECSEHILRLTRKVEMLNSLNYYDINISSEYFFMRLLNIVFGYNLKNINGEKSNFTAIDLYDTSNRIAVQVTSDTSSRKIKETIDKFVKNELYTNYDRLVFLVITNDKTYEADFDTKSKFVFDKSSDIITCKKLIKEIGKLNLDKIKEVYDYLVFELGTILDENCVWSIDVASKYISECTNQKLNLDYFEIDDNDFINNFDAEIQKGKDIYIKGNCKEETLYCILNCIKAKEINKPVYIIQNYESWEKAQKYIRDSIVIPFFNKDEIFCIKDNINIFIYGIDEIPLKDCLSLRRRKMSTIKAKLKNTVGDEGDRLARKTNGLFPFIKAELFKGHKELSLKNVNLTKTIIVSILLGAWTECDGDRAIIEKLSGIDYDKYIEEVNNYIKVEEPLFIKSAKYGNTIYYLADTQLVWSIFYDKIDNSSLINAFFDILPEVICDMDPIFEIPFEEHFSKEISCEKPTYSKNIKNGMLRSLILLALNGRQRDVDCCVNKILSKVSSLEMWGYIAQFSKDLCEASPSSFVERMDKSVDEKGFIDFFKSGGNGITSRNYYTGILFAFECLYRINKYIPTIINILMRLSEKVEKCATSNSPREELSAIFCTWHNITSLSADDKIKLAQKGIMQYQCMWYIIFEGMPLRQQMIFSSRCMFNFRYSDDVVEMTNSDVYKQNIAYFYALLDHVNNDVEKWSNMLVLLEILLEKEFKKTIDSLKTSLNCMEDAEKEKIQVKLREIIYHHRYFCKSDWAMAEIRIRTIEELCKGILYSDNIYKYLYLTIEEHNFPLYNPVPMKENSIDENRDNIEKVVVKEFQALKEDKVDICRLIEISMSKKEKCYGFGRKIGKYYSNNHFDRELYNKMLQIKGIRDILREYISQTYNSDIKVLNEALLLSKQYEESDELYVSILKIPNISLAYLEFIDKQDEAIQEKYLNNLYFSDETECVPIILEKCVKYKCAGTLLNYIYNMRESFSPEELLKYLEKVCEINFDKGDIVREHYFFVEIIKHINSYIANMHDLCMRLSIIEIHYHKLIGWENMKSTKHIFQTNANAYAEFIEIVCKKDDNKVEEKYSEDTIRYYFDLYYKANFCPGVINDKIDENVLKKWVEEFEQALIKQHQGRIFTHLLGRLFAYSPVGDDGYYPHESIRDVIEKKNSKELKSSFYTAEFNKRGVYTGSAGESEKNLALYYKKNADGIRLLYPKTAEIYDLISESYFLDAKSEREDAENGRL